MDTDNLLDLIKRVRADAEDIVGIIDFGILPMINQTNEEEFELSAEKLSKLLTELLNAKENLNKSFTALRRKIWGMLHGD